MVGFVTTARAGRAAMRHRRRMGASYVQMDKKTQNARGGGGRGVCCFGYQARAGWAKPAGASRSSSKVTTSKASSWASKARSSLLFSAWPERNAL